MKILRILNDYEEFRTVLIVWIKSPQNKPKVVAVRDPYMSQKDLFENYLYLILIFETIKLHSNKLLFLFHSLLSFSHQR